MTNDKGALDFGEMMDTAYMHRELERLQGMAAGFEAQRKLLENFIDVARSSAQGELLKSTLHKTLELAIELTGAEKGSLFLFDDQGRVSDSLLTRDEARPEERSRLIGTVMDKGLAGWVSRHRRVGLITDTQQDDRWLNLPDQPYQVRSALAVPIVRNDRIMGLLTLLHSQPAHFTDESSRLMKATSDQMALALENVGLYTRLDESFQALTQAKEEIEKYSRALDQEMEKGRAIQRDFLPADLPRIPGWEVKASFRPAWQVSGDFYDVFELPGGDWGLVIADVAGKGVGAALFMALFRSLIRAFSGAVGDHPALSSIRESAGQISPLSAVELTNAYITRVHSDGGMFATLFFGLLDPRTGRLSYVNGGHEPPVIIGPKGIRQTLCTTGPAVGLISGIEFKIGRTDLAPGESLLGFTDGVTEARSASGNFFTRERLFRILEEAAASRTDLLHSIGREVATHSGQAPQSDDITILQVRRI